MHVFENDTGPDDANHAHEGLYVLVADGVPPGRGPERALRDVAPTLLELLDEPVPAGDGGPEHAPAAASRDDSVTDTPPFPLGSKVGGGAGWPQAGAE